MRRLFDEDEHGEASLDAVRAIAHETKARSYEVPPAMLDTFLALRLDGDLSALKRTHPVSNAKVKGAPPPAMVSRRAKKRDRVVRELERELREAEARVDQQERGVPSEAIKIFLTYSAC